MWGANLGRTSAFIIKFIIVDFDTEKWIVNAHNISLSLSRFSFSLFWYSFSLYKIYVISTIRPETKFIKLYWYWGDYRYCNFQCVQNIAQYLMILSLLFANYLYNYVNRKYTQNKIYYHSFRPLYSLLKFTSRSILYLSVCVISALTCLWF